MSRRSVAGLTASSRLAVLLLTLAVAALPAGATKPDYLAQWPDVERVLADEQGANEQDTWARQMAALNQLDRAIEDMADERRWNDLTPDELALRGRYRQASGAIRQQANATLSNDFGPGFHWPWEEAPLQAWNSLQWKYESDLAFRHATLSRYLAPELLGELNARKTASDERAHAAGRRMMEDLGYRESTWSSMGGAGQDVAAMIVALLAVVVLLMLVRELRRFGLDRKDPKLLRAGFARHPLSFETGVVDRYESEHGGRVERFDLFMGFGWFQVQVGNAHVAIPEGHLATAVNTGGGKRRKFGYVMFVDHDAKSIRPVEWELRRILAPSAWLPLPIACLAGVIGAVSDPVPNAPPLVGALLFAMLAWALTTGIMKWALRRRVRRFVERDAQRIADAAGESAVHPGTPPERDADGRVIKPPPATEAIVTDEQVVAAAREVTDSLMPFVPTVGLDGRPLAAAVWTAPFFVGFLVTYAAAALQRATRPAELPKDARFDVAALVAYRLAQAHGVEDPEFARGKDGPGAKEQRQHGIWAAQFVLACFAGDPEKLAFLAEKAAPPLRLPTGMIRPDPPATALHPDGPHAAAGRRALTVMFSQQLLELGRSSD